MLEKLVTGVRSLTYTRLDDEDECYDYNVIYRASEIRRSRSVTFFTLVLYSSVISLIIALGYHGMGNIIERMNGEMKMDMRVNGDIENVTAICSSVLRNQYNGTIAFGRRFGQERLEDNVHSLNQLKIAFAAMRSKRDRLHARFANDMEILLDSMMYARFGTRGDHEDVLTRRLSSSARDLLQKDKMKRMMTDIKYESMFKEDIGRSEGKTSPCEDTRFKVTAFGIGGLRERLMDHLEILSDRKMALIFNAMVGPIFDPVLNVFNFVYRTLSLETDGNVWNRTVIFAFGDIMFLLPNLLWMGLLMYSRDVFSPLACLSDFVIDREVYAISKQTSESTFMGKINRYRFLIVIQRTIKWIIGTFYVILAISISLALLALSGAIIRDSEVDVMRWLELDDTLLSDHKRREIVDLTTTLRNLFMNPREFGFKRDAFLHSLSSEGITAFDTVGALYFRCTVLFVAWIVWKTSRSETFESHGEYKIRRDGIWSEIKRFTRCSLVVVNLYPLYSGLFSKLLGNEDPTLDIITSIVFTWCVMGVMRNTYRLLSKGNRRTFFWLSVWSFLSVSIVFLRTRVRFGHDDLFPMVGHVNVEDGLLSYVFDLGDFKTMYSTPQMRFPSVFPGGNDVISSHGSIASFFASHSHERVTETLVSM